MKIEEPQSAVLTNYEVLQHIQKVHARYQHNPDYADKPNFKQQDLHRIVNDVILRLTTPPSPLAANPLYNRECIATLVQRLAKFQLTKSELVMLFNLRPKDADALEPVIEEADTRFSQGQLEEIADVVSEVLGSSEEIDGELDDAS